ncbi:MAG: XRE family transcriptional regulator [Faecalibacterium sp.]
MDHEAIWALIRSSGYKLNYIARVLNITPNTLRLKLNGENEFKLSEAQCLARLLELDAAQRERYFFGAKD